MARKRRPVAAPAETSVGGRLRAWWSGAGAAPAPEPAPAAPPAEVEAPEASEAPVNYWTPAAIEIAQRVWGPDYLGPTDEAYVRHVLKPLGISPSLSIVEIGSGLGGGARAIARDYDAWVTGLETDPTLAEAGMNLSVRSNLAKMAPIRHFDPDRTSLRTSQYDRIVVRDTLGQIEDKPKFLQMMRQSMKDKAQLLMTDFVLAERGAGSAKVEAWIEAQPGTPRPMTAAALLKTLKELNLRVHVAEDESAEIARIVTGRWDRMRSGLKPSSLSPELVEPTLREGERWQHCVNALASGGLRYYRIVASI